MPVLVMDIRIVRMSMRQQRMHMAVRMRFIRVARKLVGVLVMFVVAMPMRVRQGIVDVFVIVPFGQVKANAARHEGKRDPERQGGRFTEE